jgi:ubiquinone/menaquinone biosynthesis C-methylase UbiE
MVSEVMNANFQYTEEPKNKKEFTEKFDKSYTRIAGIYNLFAKYFPIWKTWITRAIPHIRGPRVLEVSFGTGYLLTRYADKFETHGIDYNEKMLSIAKKNLENQSIKANLVQGNVESLPYEDEFFDSIINTMAFSGYPDGEKALTEMIRTLKNGGRLIMIDVNYPSNGNWMGMKMAKFWSAAGDIIRDMDSLLNEFNLEYEKREIGGSGSVHLYVIKKN